MSLSHKLDFHVSTHMKAYRQYHHQEVSIIQTIDIFISSDLSVSENAITILAVVIVFCVVSVHHDDATLKFVGVYATPVNLVILVLEYLIIILPTAHRNYWLLYHVKLVALTGHRRHHHHQLVA